MLYSTSAADEREPAAAPTALTQTARAVTRRRQWREGNRTEKVDDCLAPPSRPRHPLANIHKRYSLKPPLTHNGTQTSDWSQSARCGASVIVAPRRCAEMTTSKMSGTAVIKVKFNVLPSSACRGSQVTLILARYSRNNAQATTHTSSHHDGKESSACRVIIKGNTNMGAPSIRMSPRA